MPDTALTKPTTEATTMPLGDHLEELRRRIILGLVGILPIFVAALAFGQEIIEVLVGPLRGVLRTAGQATTLIATGPLETFATYLHVSFIATLLVGSPWLLYQLWKFVAPGLYSTEKRFVHILVPMSTILTIGSAAFMYFLVLPVVLAFFVGFGTQIGRQSPTLIEPPGEEIVLPELPLLPGDPPEPPVGSAWINTETMQLRVAIPRPGAPGRVAVVGSDLIVAAGITQQYRVSEYIKTVLNLALAFAVGFQTPVVVLLLGWAGLVTRATLRRYWKAALMVCVVAGALLTPADPLSMLLLAVPLYLLFELGLALLIVFPPKHAWPVEGPRDG